MPEEIRTGNSVVRLVGVVATSLFRRWHVYACGQSVCTVAAYDHGREKGTFVVCEVISRTHDPNAAYASFALHAIAIHINSGASSLSAPVYAITPNSLDDTQRTVFMGAGFSVADRWGDQLMLRLMPNPGAIAAKIEPQT